MSTNNSFRIYPEVSTQNTNEIDISNNVSNTLQNADQVQLKYIGDFLKQLESDFKKYGNKNADILNLKVC